MPLSLILGFVFAQGQTNSPGTKTVVTPIGTTVVQASSPSAQQPFTIAEPNRIALTPRIDGKLDDEEWDPLASSPEMKSYFQWEPGKLYFAAVVPDGHDVVASFDLHADGWLHGKDNLEIRVSNIQGQVSVVGRLLDGTDIAGPKWIDLPGISTSTKAFATSDGKNTTYEVGIKDIGFGLLPTEKGSKILMRIDDPLSTEAPAPAYLPRLLAPATLVMMRSAALPPKLNFNPEGVGKSTVAGEGIRIRLAFDGNNAMNIRRLEMHSEGLAKNDTVQQAVPFPKFDDKGRSYVDYDTPIADGSSEGYRVLRGTLITADNISALMECSYHIGALVDFHIPTQRIALATVDRSVKLTFNARSNSGKRIAGDVTIVVPDPLRVLNGPSHKIEIYGSHSQISQGFELFLPPSASGTYPVKFLATINGKKYEQTEFITVGGI